MWSTTSICHLPGFHPWKTTGESGKYFFTIDPFNLYYSTQHYCDEQIKDEANRRRAVGIKFCGVMLVAALHLVLSSQYPISDLSGTHFVKYSTI